MGPLGRLVVAAIVLAAFGFLVAILFVSALVALAFVAPLIGFSYLASRIAAAGVLWRSGGRFEIGDGIRIIGASRARVLALLVCLQGAGGLLLSLVPAAIAVGAPRAIGPLLIVGIASHAGARFARARVLEGANPIDVLPPR